MPIPEFIVRLREKIGHDPLWLPGVTAVVTDPGDRLLLVRRADDGRWTPVTGIVDPGEEPAVAARREVAEEAGVECVVERLASTAVTGPVQYENGDLATYLDLTFACRWVSGTAHVADDESTDVGWFARDALPAMDAEFLQRISAALDGGPEATFVR
ncbi:MAG: NUDIX domain-containing protein [Nocardioidaceae bacterium]|nr:NUDIX domain-containing protein [Nocardioidaceae bacterium]